MSSGVLAARARGKVNLHLHVGPVGSDGYHPIASLISFADFGDEVRLGPGAELSLTVDGPFARHAPADEANLALRAARVFVEETGVGEGAIRVSKQIPAGAGLGGGSADAAAVLRLMRDRFRPELEDAALEVMGASLGADIPACVRGGALIAQGRGERLSPAPTLSVLHAVLVWPGFACSTAAVYGAFDAMAGEGTAEAPPSPVGSGFEAVIDWLAAARNDLEPAALAVEPRILEVLRALRTAPQSRLARMSGSGSACFALCGSEPDTQALASLITANHPEWWVRACKLG